MEESIDFSGNKLILAYISVLVYFCLKKGHFFGKDLQTFVESQGKLRSRTFVLIPLGTNGLTRSLGNCVCRDI